MSNGTMNQVARFLKQETLYVLPAMWKEVKVFEGTVSVYANTPWQAKELAEKGKGFDYQEKEVIHHPPLKVAVVGEPTNRED